MRVRAAATASTAVAAIAGAAILIAATPAIGGTGGQVEALDVTAGQTVFSSSCSGCHPAGGSQAGVGPILKDRGLSRAAIENQTINGGAGMPGGLVSGTNLTDVVDYVVSIQGGATSPGVRARTPTAALKAAIKKAHVRYLKAKKLSTKGLKGPLKGSPNKVISQVKWARVGTTEWAIGTFTRNGAGAKGQPQIFRRVGSKPWADLGPSKTCFKKIPAEVREAMKIPKGRC